VCQVSGGQPLAGNHATHSPGRRWRRRPAGRPRAGGSARHPVGVADPSAERQRQLRPYPPSTAPPRPAGERAAVGMSITVDLAAARGPAAGVQARFGHDVTIQPTDPRSARDASMMRIWSSTRICARPSRGYPMTNTPASRAPLDRLGDSGGAHLVASAATSGPSSPARPDACADANARPSPASAARRVVTSSPSPRVTLRCHVTATGQRKSRRRADRGGHAVASTAPPRNSAWTTSPSAKATDRRRRRAVQIPARHPRPPALGVGRDQRVQLVVTALRRGRSRGRRRQAEERKPHLALGLDVASSGSRVRIVASSTRSAAVGAMPRCARPYAAGLARTVLEQVVLARE